MNKRFLISAFAAIAFVISGSTAATAATVNPAPVSDDLLVPIAPPPAPSAKDAPTVGKAGLKGKPTKAGKSASSKALFVGPYYFYNTGVQTVNNTGASVALGIYNPGIDVGDHSLAEIAVRGGTNQGDTVEVGWTQDPGVCPNSNACLFVFNWTAGTPGCYNGCGYVDYAPNTTTYAGMDLSAYLNTNRTFTVLHSGSEWWIAFNGAWIGYFPDSDWSGSGFTQATETQYFGEVASPSNSAPCTNMGKGVLAAPPSTGGVISSAVYYNTSGTQTNSSLSWVEASAPSAGSISSQYHVNPVTLRTATYGGPGYC